MCSNSYLRHFLSKMFRCLGEVNSFFEMNIYRASVQDGQQSCFNVAQSSLKIYFQLLDAILGSDMEAWLRQWGADWGVFRHVWVGTPSSSLEKKKFIADLIKQILMLYGLQLIE